MTGHMMESSNDTDPALESDPLHSRAGGRSVGHWFVLGAGGMGLVALGALRFFATPDGRGYGTHTQFGLPPCLTMSAGVPCPGCGVTTSVTLFAHGEVVQAFLNQPFGMLVALGIPVFVAWAVWAHVRGLDLYLALTGRNLKRWVVPALVAMVAAWAYKLVATFVA